MVVLGLYMVDYADLWGYDPGIAWYASVRPYIGCFIIFILLSLYILRALYILHDHHLASGNSVYTVTTIYSVTYIVFYI